MGNVGGLGGDTLARVWILIVFIFRETEISSDERIVRGTKSRPNAYPFMVHLLMKGIADEICGGSWINPYFILTAGHCIKKINGVEVQHIQVKLGIHNRVDKHQPHMQNGEVETWYYKAFNHTNLHNDIALLKMKEPINFTEAVKPACLPTPGYHYPEGLARALGWGSTREELQEVDLPILPDNECKNIYRRYFDPKIAFCAGYKEGVKDTCGLRIGVKEYCNHNIVLFYPVLYDTQLLVVLCHKKGKNTYFVCAPRGHPLMQLTVSVEPGLEKNMMTQVHTHGDSDGPLFIKDDSENFVVIGITSFTKGGCARPDHFAVYTKVSSFTDWIVGKASQGGHICIANFEKSK